MPHDAVGSSAATSSAVDFAPLTPVSFLQRAAKVFGTRTAIVDRALSFTYDDFWNRSTRLAGALVALGVEPGDRVAALCANSHEMLELRNAVPLCRGVLVSLNTRLSTEELDWILRHSGSRLIAATGEHADVAQWLARRIGIPAVIADDRVTTKPHRGCRADSGFRHRPR